MQKLIFSSLLVLSYIAGCEPYDDTYAQTQKQIDAQIAEEKLVFDEYVSEALDKEEVYKKDSIVKDTVINTRASGCIFLFRNGFRNGKSILPEIRSESVIPIAKSDATQRLKKHMSLFHLQLSSFLIVLML